MQSRLYACPIVQRAMRGQPPGEIARELGVKPGAVYNRLTYVRSRGVDVRNFARGTEDTRRTILQLSLDGMSGAAIARHLGIKQHTVLHVLNRARQSGEMVPPPRPVRVDVDPQTAAALARAAAPRGLCVAELARALLAAMAAEPVLLANIMDDGVAA